MCPYIDKGCTIVEKHEEYKNTDLCICEKRYTGCPGYVYAEINGVNNMPKDALDWSWSCRKK